MQSPFNSSFDNLNNSSTNNMNNMMDSPMAASGNFASTFRSRNTAMSAEELRKARESRAADALKMKDEQLKILTEQNSNLLKSLDKVEEDANTIQLEKLAIEQENRSLRDTNFELQSKTRAAETLSKRMQAEVADKEKQLRIMTDQNSELLRLLESEESLTTQLQSTVAELRAELDELKQKHGALLSTAKTHEELAIKAAKEGQLRAEEIRLLRVETEQLKQQNSELKMKTQVEVEALQEQLRVRKEKQYQLLEKLQAQEEAKRQAQDQVAGMEEQLRGLHAKNIDLDTQIKSEARAKFSFEEMNKDLQVENGNLFNHNKELQMKIEKSEKERIRMEAEARDAGEQLREMAEKVFQLLERLKLAELGKTKAMDALKKKEQDLIGIQKKNSLLIKEANDQGESKMKAELDVKTLQEQVRALKKSNTTLTQKSKEEAKLKVKSIEECEQLNEKIKTMESRLSFLLNKVQADEENRIIQAEDRKKLEAQLISYTEKCDELQHKLIEIGESNRIITQAMRLKQDELNDLLTKYDVLVKEKLSNEHSGQENNEDMTGARPGGPDDIDNVRLNEGRGRFYVEAKSIGGGSLLLLRARKPLYREWLDKLGVNDFLKRSQKTTRFRELVVEKFGAVYGLLMVEEEEKMKLQEDMKARDEQVDHIQKKLAYIQDNLAVEEDAKRRMLLRYIHAVKEHAMVVNEGSGGVIQLPESNISDEEIHALAALLRNNTSIEELNLRGNNITDDGARALGAVLAGKSSLRLVDLRGNKIGKRAIRVLAEALERAERVRHVYVHAGGKIEALGVSRWAQPRNTLNSTGPLGSPGDDLKNTNTSDGNGNAVETICVVDIRENNPENTSFPYELNRIDGTGTTTTMNRPSSSGKNTGPFHPRNMLESTKVPGKDSLVKKTKSKKEGKLRSSGNASDTEGEPMSDVERKKSKVKIHEEKLLAIRESAWRGRAAGLDIDKSVNNLDVSLKESIRLRKKNPQLLPPLTDISSNNANDGRSSNLSSPTRGNSAPTPKFGKMQESFQDEPEGIILNHTADGSMIQSNKMDGKKKKSGKGSSSELEKRLMNSPFSQPVVRHLQLEDHLPSENK